MAEYSKKRASFLALHPWCQVWLSDNGETEDDVFTMVDGTGWIHSNRGFDMVWVQVPRSVEIHHKRGRTGLMLLNEEFWLAVSRNGHNFIHNNPKEAYERGFMLRR